MNYNNAPILGTQIEGQSQKEIKMVCPLQFLNGDLNIPIGRIWIIDHDGFYEAYSEEHRKIVYE